MDVYVTFSLKSRIRFQVYLNFFPFSLYLLFERVKIRLTIGKSRKRQRPRSSTVKWNGPCGVILARMRYYKMKCDNAKEGNKTEVIGEKEGKKRSNHPTEEEEKKWDKKENLGGRLAFLVDAAQKKRGK